MTRPARRTAREKLSVWILGDQLRFDHPALAAAEQEVGRERVRVVLVESEARKRKLPYQRKKLVLLMSAMRHFAQALRERGVEAEHVRARDFRAGLRAHLERHRPAQLLTMAAADWAGRRWQTQRAQAALGVPLRVLPNTQFLVGRHDPLPDAPAGKRVVMETFYRAMRTRFGLLMKGGEPEGGRWNFDAENREPLPAELRRDPAKHVPALPRFEADALTREVMREVEAAGHGVGSAAGFDYAVTHEDAQRALRDFVARRLDRFGPYEDAMSERHGTLFHSVLSPYVNLGLLDPLEMARAAETAYRAKQARLASAEGFVRQVVGWREFMYWQYWRLMPGLERANAWGAQRPLPSFFWDAQTEMHCLRSVIARSLDTGYAHHIERLMLLGNFSVLAGLEPQAVTRWFEAVFVDAYDWVMQSNVVGMALNADGGKIATKPYVASASYVQRMSDYCGSCRFDPKARTGADACPFNALYWSFHLEHEKKLAANPRIGFAARQVKRFDAKERRAIREQARRFLDAAAAPEGR